MCERKWSWLNFKCYTGNYQEKLNKSTKNASVSDVRPQIEVRVFQI